MKRYAFKSTACFAEHEGGGWVEYSDHLAAIQQLTGRIAQVEKERDSLKCREQQLGRQLAMAAIDVADANDDRDRLADELTNTRVSRDSANDRADRAERELYNLQKDVGFAFRKHGLAPGPEAVNGLVRQLAEVSQERDDWKLSAGNVGEIIAKYESTIDELKRGKSCAGCLNIEFTSLDYDACSQCERLYREDYYEPRDPSAEQGGGK